MDKLVLQAVEEVALEGPEGKRRSDFCLFNQFAFANTGGSITGCTARQLWQLLNSRLPAEVSKLTNTLKTLLLSELRKRSDVIVKASSAAATKA